MRRGFAGMAVGMKMRRAVAVAVFVEMHTIAPQPPQHVRAEDDQHHADGGLHRPGDGFRDGAAEQNGGAGKGEQRQRMTEPSGQPVLDDIAHMAAARGDAGYGGDMIGFERMLHAQQKPQPQNTEHTTPNPLCGSSKCPAKALATRHFHPVAPSDGTSHRMADRNRTRWVVRVGAKCALLVSRYRLQRPAMVRETGPHLVEWTNAIGGLR